MANSQRMIGEYALKRGGLLPPMTRTGASRRIKYQARKEVRSDASKEYLACIALLPGEWIEFPSRIATEIRNRLAVWRANTQFGRELNGYKTKGGGFIVIKGEVPPPAPIDCYEIHAERPPVLCEGPGRPAGKAKYGKEFATIEKLKPGEWFELPVQNKASMEQLRSRNPDLRGKFSVLFHQTDPTLCVILKKYTYALGNQQQTP